MKRNVCAWLGGFMLMLGFLFGFSAAAWADLTGVVTGETVNIRSGPATTYEVIDSAARGAVFVVVNEQDGWYQIRHTSNVNAWISATFLSVTQNSDLPASVRATSGNVNIRSGPGTEHTLLGTLGTTPLDVTGESGYWYQVRYNNQTAYVAKWLVTASYEAAPAPVVDSNYAPALVNTDTLNLRDAPSGEIVDRLERNTRLYVRGSRDGWYQVQTADGLTGWVYGEYLLFDQAQNQAALLTDLAAPAFAGASAQGQISISYQQQSYGYKLVLEGDTLIHYSVSESARSLRIETDMAFTGGLPTGGSLQMAFSGDFANVLTITGTDAIHYSLEVENHGRRLTLTVGPSPLLGRLIFIDPGHASVSESGIVDPGATDGNGLYEKDIVYDIALRMQAILLEGGAQVLLSRAEVSDTTLAQRAAAANAAGADVLVSVHVNSFTNSSANGSSTWFYAPADDDAYDRARTQLLAQCIQAQMLSYGGLGDYGVREANFAILRHSEMPAVLLETGFITNETDARALADASWRQRLAEGICQGLLDYFSQIN